MIELDPNFLCGSYPPLITPFRDDEVDLDAYAAMVEFQVSAGSHGLVVCGTTGEPSMLTVSERKRLAAVAIDAAGGRIPVLVATGSQNLAETLELSEHATDAGADALLVVTPYYVRPPQRGLTSYFGAIAARSPLPLLLYHIPGRAAVGVTVETLSEISELAENFVGIKHASTDLSLVTEALLNIGPEFRIFVGLEELSFPMMALGACGMINAVSNIAPKEIVALYDAVRSDSIERARQVHQRLFELNQAVFFDTNPIPLKYMMWRIGIVPSNSHRLPMMPPTQEVADRLDGVLERAGLI